jgi:hypothetical protein
MDSNTFLRENKAYQSSLNFFTDLIEPPIGNPGVTGDLMEPFSTNKNIISSKENRLMGLINDVLLGVD